MARNRERNQMTRKEFHKELDRNIRAMGLAYLAAIGQMRRDSLIGEVAREVYYQNIDGVMEAIQFDDAHISPLVMELTRFYMQSGKKVVEKWPRLRRRPNGPKVKIRFDVTNPRAEAQVRSQALAFVRELQDEQRDALRIVISEGYNRGDGPAKIALDIVGRIDARTKKREGGVLGLTTKQAEWSQNAADELNSGNPTLLKRYLSRQRRDQRFDRAVIREMLGISKMKDKTKAAAARSYNNRLLKMRGDAIARTETLGAMSAATMEAALQLLDSGAVDREHIKKIWDATGDDRTRETHQEASGQEKPIDALFDVGDSKMRYPSDPLGSAKERIQCRCWMRLEIDFIAAEASRNTL